MECVVERSGSEVPALSEFHPLLQRVYAARGVQSPEDVALELTGLLPASQLLGVDVAAKRLAEAIMQGQNILIVGDFDVDGATSSALAVLGLRAMGAEHIAYLVPSRFTYGYGLSPEIVDVAHEQSPDVIVTVDNGIFQPRRG